jgi:ATP-binding cassette subfamily F protein uup
MAPPLLLLQDIHLRLGTAPLLAGASLALSAGERLCLVGRNGSGKSTLLKIAAGTLPPDAGSRFLQPGTTLAALPQEPDLSGHADVAAYVAAGLGPGDAPHRARRLLEALGLSGDEAPASLSGGEARRAALARVLAPRPDILLLDEPTNHLDLPAIAWLEAELAALGSALIIISHDRRLLESLGRTVLWLDRGSTRRLDRGFAAFEGWRDDILEQEARERHKLGRKLAMEEDWLRYGVTARRTRNQRRLADLHSLRERRRQQRAQAPRLKLAQGAEAEGSGTLVIAAEEISLSLGGRPILRDFSTSILRGDRVGIVGGNGAGKTTLLRLLTGQLAPDSGRVRLGSNLLMETLDQKRESLDPIQTLAAALTGGDSDQVVVGGKPRHVVGYMQDFLFAPEQARSPVGVLSGGERGRLMLARALSRPANLLVLDEPTNDLDLETLDLLQELLADFPGTILLVSHDRDFLDRVATSVIVAEGEGRWLEYAGGYSDMLAQRGAPPGGVLRPARPLARAAPAPAAPPPVSREKLSFKERHALQTLPARIAALQDAAQTLAALLADGGLYARDATGFARAAATLATTEAKLAKAEEAWLELELRREALEGG